MKIRAGGGGMERLPPAPEWARSAGEEVADEAGWGSRRWNT